ncbi:MAG: magnesium transporter MgtE [Nitrospirales bacterium]|nr:MAG: magnesium transporter MgtE [Nitrospirales bacterium]
MPKPELKELVRQKAWSALKVLLEAMPPPETAEVLAHVEQADRVLLFHMLPRSQSVEIFSYLDSSIQESLLTELTDADTQEILTKLRPDDRTVLLEGLPRETLSRLLRLLNPQDLQEARHLLGYPEESVGRLMTPDYVAVLPVWTVEQSLRHIRTRGQGSETISIIYVTDENWKLLDALELERFVLANPSDTVAQIMNNAFIALSAQDDREEAVRQMQKYDLLALPVINDDDILLGIVTVDDVLDVAEEEATEDIQKGAAIEPLKSSYRESSIWSLYQKRIPWLAVLMLVNLAASGVIVMYEETLASALALAFFIPLLMGSGGNTGAQAATLMVRALATDDIKVSQWFNAMVKEIFVGSILGITLGIGVGLIGYWRGEATIGLAVGLAMAAIVVVSNLIGVLFPVILTKLHVDPAVAGSPMVTSTADVTSLILYFSIATTILGKLNGNGM